jgi:CheY-like chemotaxis protein
MLLLVDDDPVFLRQAGKQLNPRDGVLFARNADQAKALMSSVGARFSVLMIDLDLPGDEGPSLIREMRERFPDLPVIAISGVCEPRVHEIAREAGAVETLSKPITPEWNGAIARVRAMRDKTAAGIA